MRVVAAVFGVAAIAAAPVPDRLTLFSGGFYRGDRLVFEAPEGDIRLDFTPRSVRTVGRWLACSEVRFAGRCIEIDRDHPVDSSLGIEFNIRSLRPMAPGSGTARPAPTAVPEGASMTGMAARFFAAPRFGSERALACVGGGPGLGCAKKTAADLCQRAGYRRAAHFALQVERGLYYLADVLCVGR